MSAGTRKGFTMKASRYIVFSFLLSLVSFSLAAQINDTYVIPAAGNTPGALGTLWATQFSVFNPQSYDLRVSVTFVPTGGGKGLEKLIRVPANSVTFSDNILADLYTLSNTTGALLVATFPEDNPGVADNVVARSFLVETNTFNNSHNGTFGQTIPGVWAGLEDTSNPQTSITAIAHGIRNLKLQGWRTNIGALNLGRTDVTMRVSVYDIDGHTILNKAPFNIPPLAHFQDPLPIEVDRGSVEFFLDDPSKQAVVFPYVSVIDALSGDPTYHSPTLLAKPSVLFPNGSVAAKAALLESTGRKIDTEYARGVRDNATRLGEATLLRTTQKQRTTSVR
jgi:hypothetical protein